MSYILPGLIRVALEDDGDAGIDPETGLRTESIKQLKENKTFETEPEIDPEIEETKSKIPNLENANTSIKKNLMDAINSLLSEATPQQKLKLQSIKLKILQKKTVTDRDYDVYMQIATNTMAPEDNVMGIKQDNMKEMLLKSITAMIASAEPTQQVQLQAIKREIAKKSQVTQAEHDSYIEKAADIIEPKENKSSIKLEDSNPDNDFVDLSQTPPIKTTKTHFPNKKFADDNNKEEEISLDPEKIKTQVETNEKKKEVLNNAMELSNKLKSLKSGG